jgi:2-polyprenyl-3-methyl-5-hydroxy-6-metoxy-1,4-benzoquinol methylase
MRDGSDRSAAVVVPLVIDLVRPASVVDVGCGTGAWLARFQEHGVRDVFSLEFSEVNPRQTHLDRAHIRIVDVSQLFCLEREFDLVLSLEVAEHLPVSMPCDHTGSRESRTTIVYSPNKQGMNIKTVCLP